MYFWESATLTNSVWKRFTLENFGNLDFFTIINKIYVIYFKDLGIH